MKFGLSLFLLASAVASAGAFAPANSVVSQARHVELSTAAASTALSMSAATEVTPFVQGPRIVRDELPIVYVYDHCPFCVRVRLALGIMNVKHNVHFLANDDIPTPTKLVGKKIAPIFVSWRRLYDALQTFDITMLSFLLLATRRKTHSEIFSSISSFDFPSCRRFLKTTLL